MAKKSSTWAFTISTALASESVLADDFIVQIDVELAVFQQDGAEKRSEGLVHTSGWRDRGRYWRG